MMPLTLRSCARGALIAACCLLGCCAFMGCVTGAFAAAPAAVATSTAPWWLQSATIWDVLKWLIASLVAVAGWAIRVEMTLAKHTGTLESQGQTLCKHDEIIASSAKLIEKHESLLEAHIKTLDHIERTLSEWSIVKEERAERLMRIETRLDRLDKIEVKLDYVLQARQERYDRQERT